MLPAKPALSNCLWWFPRNLGTEVEVVKGLSPSDRVVNSPPDSLAAGDLVHIAYGYGLFTGGLGFHYGAEYLGCTGQGRPQPCSMCGAVLTGTREFGRRRSRSCELAGGHRNDRGRRYGSGGCARFENGGGLARQVSSFLVA